MLVDRTWITRRGRQSPHRLLDTRLHIVGEFRPAGRKQLDAVVVVRVVRSRNDCAHGTKPSPLEGDRRRRRKPESKHVNALASQTSNQCCLQHGGRYTTVSADDRLRGEPRCTKDLSRSAAQVQCERGS